MVGGDLGGLLLRASGLKLGPLGQGGPQSGRDLGIVEGGSRMEEFSGRKLTLGNLGAYKVPDLGVFGTMVAPESPGKVEYQG